MKKQKKRNTRRSKAPFTLLELLVCFLILALAGGVVAWNLKEMYASQKIESSLQQIFAKLQECRSLSLSYQIDISLEIFQEEQGIAYRVTTDEPLKGYNRSVTHLSDQCHFTFKGKPINHLVLQFSPNGWLENRGVIEIERQGSKRWIDLSTAPHMSVHKQKPHVRWPTETLPAYPTSRGA